MKVVVCLVLFCVFMGILNQIGEAKETTNLDATNFDQQTSSGNWMIKFYAPWCGHCKRLAPTWAKLAAAADDTLNVARVDCTKNENADLCDKYGVMSYPTIKLILDKRGTKSYNGERTVDAFLTFYNQFKN